MIKYKGSLMNLAQKQLEKEEADGLINSFNGIDIINHMIKIRKWLDKKDSKKIELTKSEKKFLRRQKYLRTGN